MSAIRAIARKDLRLLLRDRMALFWTLGFPILFAVFFGSIYGGGGGGTRAIPLAVVDEDHTPFSAAFVTKLQASSSVRVTTESSALIASNSVRKGSMAAALVLRPGMGKFPAILRGADPALELISDPSRGAEAAMLQGVLAETAFSSLADLINDPTWFSGQLSAGIMSTSSPAMARQNQFLRQVEQFQRTGGWGGAPADAATTTPRRTMTELFGLGTPTRATTTSAATASSATAEDSATARQLLNIKVSGVARDLTGQPRSPFDLTFPSAILWGLIGCVTAFSLSLVQERTAGTLLRLCLAPISRRDVLAGKALACLTACAVVAGILLTVAQVVFHVRPSSMPMLLLAVASLSLCFTGLMMLIASLGKTPASVNGAGWAVFLVWSMFGGGMVPLIFMPGWMARLSDFSPVKWGILAIEGGLWRGFSPQEMMIPCGILLAVGVAAFALGVALFRRTDSR